MTAPWVGQLDPATHRAGSVDVDGGGGSVADMPDPKHVAKRSTRPLVLLLYVVVLLVAGYGQATGIVKILGWPFFLAIPVVAVMELFAVVFAAHADERRAEHNESARAARVLAFALAGFAVVINWAGHYETNKILAGFFSALSAAGFFAWLIIAGSRRRDILRAKGQLAEQAPRYGLLWLTDFGIARRARALAVEKPALKLHGSIKAARAEMAAADRRRAIYSLVREDMNAAFGPEVAELVATVADPDRLAAEIERRVDWQQIAAALAARVDPERFSEAVARADKKRAADARADRAADGTARATDRALTRAETRAPKRAANGARARSERAEPGARADWWTRARGDWYTRVYAARLDETGEEIGGSDLAKALGVDPGRARSARDQKLRARYAEEVARGARTPRDGVQLPPPIAARIAERAARGMTGELRQIGTTP